MAFLKSKSDERRLMMGAIATACRDLRRREAEELAVLIVNRLSDAMK